MQDSFSGNTFLQRKYVLITVWLKLSAVRGVSWTGRARIVRRISVQNGNVDGFTRLLNVKPFQARQR